MGRFRDEDIYAYYVSQMVLCPECISDEEEKNLKQDDLIFESVVAEDEKIFCDRCKARLD